MNPDEPRLPPSANGVGVLKATKKWRKKRVASLSASKKATAPRPAITPIKLPSSIHLRRYEAVAIPWATLATQAAEAHAS